MSNRYELPVEKWIDALMDATDNAQAGDTIVVHSYAQRKAVLERLERLDRGEGVVVKWENAQLVRFQTGEIDDPSEVARAVFKAITGKEPSEEDGI